MSDSPTPKSTSHPTIPGPFTPEEWLNILSCVTFTMEHAGIETPTGVVNALSVDIATDAIWRVLGEDAEPELRAIGKEMDVKIGGIIAHLGLTQTKDPSTDYERN